MQQTTNYQLPQWEAGDRIRREDFNGAMSKLDTALAAVAGSVAGAGNCRIAWGSYVGDGARGEDNPTVISCEFYPLIAFIGATSNVGYFDDPMILMREMTTGESGFSIRQSPYVRINWSDNGVSWYNPSSVEDQHSKEGLTYYYVVIGCTKS